MDSNGRVADSESTYWPKFRKMDMITSEWFRLPSEHECECPPAALEVKYNPRD